MTSLRALAGLAAVAGFFTGCGSITAVSPDGGGGAGGGGIDAPVEVAVTTTEACRQQAVAVCDALELCATVAVKFFYVDKATCVSRLMLSCTTDQMVPGITRTSADILACKQEVAAATCADLLASKFPASCLVKPGAQPSGAVCGSDWQCASTFCSKEAAACGACAVRSGAGGVCTIDAGCETGLVCANKVCVIPALPSMACDVNHPCRGDLYCTKLIFGSCLPKVGAGGSCADSDKACDIFKSVGCNPSTHVCEPFDVASGGNACGILNNVLTLCANLGPCPGFPTGVCANPAADGAACGDAANGVVCLPPATCDSGTCRLPSVPSCQ
jgi:hypothetical protein